MTASDLLDIDEVSAVLGYCRRHCRRLLAGLLIRRIRTGKTGPGYVFKWRTSDILQRKKDLDLDPNKRLKHNQHHPTEEEKSRPVKRRKKPY